MTSTSWPRIHASRLSTQTSERWGRGHLGSPGSQPAPVDDVCAFLGPLQVNALPALPAERIAYGRDSQQFGELRLPQSPGPHPVAVVIHGGCWKASTATSSPISRTPRRSRPRSRTGLATWNIEYRRTDTQGGGSPGTFGRRRRRRSPARARAHVPARPAARGDGRPLGWRPSWHWAAARHRLPPQSDLHARDPLRVAGVVNLAGPADLEAFLRRSNVFGEPCSASCWGAASGGARAVPHGQPPRLLPIG